MACLCGSPQIGTFSPRKYTNTHADHILFAKDNQNSFAFLEISLLGVDNDRGDETFILENNKRKIVKF